MMSKALLNDVLLQSVGKSIMTKKGKSVGDIIEVTRNSENHYINYLILKCEQDENHCSRFFAVPASTRFITISDTFTIYFQYPKEDIFLAQNVQSEMSVATNLKYGKTIFEIDDYQSPDERKNQYLSLQDQEKPQKSDFPSSSPTDGRQRDKKYQNEQKKDNVSTLAPVP